MSPEAAVQFLYADKISSGSDRASLISEYEEKVSSPVEAARLGEVDDIVVAEELRQRVCAALEMMMAEG